MITASNRNTVKLNEDSGCRLSLQEVLQRRGDKSGHSTLWWFRINLTTETETVKHCNVSWTQTALINCYFSHPKPPRWCRATEKSTSLLLTFKHFFVFNMFTFHLFYTGASCRGQQRCDPSLASHPDTLLIESVNVSFFWNVRLMLSCLIAYNTVTNVWLQTVEL